MKKLIIIIMMITAHNISGQNFKTVKEAKGLPVGIKAPEFSAIDADSNTFYLEKALKSLETD